MTKDVESDFRGRGIVNDPSRKLFERYSRHYEAILGNRERLTYDPERILRDRLPSRVDGLTVFDANIVVTVRK